MNTKRQLILFIGPSQLLYIGISGLLRNPSNNYEVVFCNGFRDAEKYLTRTIHPIIIIVDGIIAESNQKLISLYKKENQNFYFIVLLYQYLSNTILSEFNQVIRIDQDPHEIITQIVQAISEKNSSKNEDKQPGILTDREIDVLRLMVKGLSGKEIADQLNISINTVISHKKNISFKVGVKSLAGLTIYAVSNKIISIDSIKKDL